MNVQWADHARRDMKRLPRDLADRIVRSVLRFADTGQGDVKALVGAEGERRLRVGDWRVRFTVDTTADVLTVLRVLHRREAYQR